MNPKLIESMRGTPPPKSTEEAWKEHYLLQEQYIEELENRLRALWDKYEGDRKHYMERIQHLDAELERTKQDRNSIAKNAREPLLLKLDEANQRIKRLEEAGDAAIHEAAFDREVDALEIWTKAKEDKP